MRKPNYHFADRRAAGRLLAERLTANGLCRPVVLALSNGGVPVGFEIARALGAELEVVAPGQSAGGRALLSDVQLLNRQVVMADDGSTSLQSIAQTAAALKREGARRLILAIAALPADAIVPLQRCCDAVVCLVGLEAGDRLADRFRAFHDIGPAEIAHYLRDSRDPNSPPAPPMTGDGEQPSPGGQTATGYPA
jgi:putative phosphoribosyl transferase